MQKNHQITVGIIGLGYVGLPLALNFSRAGMKVMGFEANKEFCNSINKSKSYISHIADLEIKNATERGFIAVRPVLKPIFSACAIDSSVVPVLEQFFLNSRNSLFFS